MKLDQNLYQHALDFLKKRFGDEAWRGVAAMYTEDGSVLLSTAPDVENESVSLCHETGAICEAFKLNKKITASICISQDDQGNIVVLTPCGICQERLYSYGGRVEVAVPVNKSATEWNVKTLEEVQPYYWRKPFME